MASTTQPPTPEPNTMPAKVHDIIDELSITDSTKPVELLARTASPLLAVPSPQFSQRPTSPSTMTSTATNHYAELSPQEFIAIVAEVRQAIQSGQLPLRILQGSSGSYFCRDRELKTVAVFKPKNEEPYGQLNPKWTKWIHRNLFPCCFGRSR